MKKIIIVMSLSLLVLSSALFAEGLASKAPENAQVYFIQPIDGQTINGTVKIIFGLKNMGVAPAGTDRQNTGHHHLLIDTEVLPSLSQSLPATDKIRHFGGGQTETEITLSPGKHTLQLILGNYAHVPHESPVMSKKIVITVK